MAGIAAGAALGILFAPEKGKDTRRKISKKGMDLTDEINDTIDKKFNALLEALTCKVNKTNATVADTSKKE
jgi:gas vesicle protein